MDNNNNNTLMIFVIGIAAVIGVFFMGNWIVNCNRNHHHDSHRGYRHHHHDRRHDDVHVRVNPNVDVRVNPYQRRYYHPQYHSNERFWHGYWDGYYNRPCRMGNCPIYNGGYRTGKYDCTCGRPHYYNDYCPSSVRVNVPGFRFELK